MITRPAALVSLAALLVAVACDPSSEESSPTDPAFSTGANAGGEKGTTSTEVGVSGAVSSLTGTCPTLSFTVGGKTIKTTASTSWGDKKCSDLKSGDQVGVAGTAQADGSILASKVKWASATTTSTEVGVSGAVSGLSGACPTLSFTVGGKIVKTTAATVWGDRGCAGLKNGDEVGVAGVAQADGSILASKVKWATTTTTTEVGVSGAVSALTGTCPTLSFTVGGKTVKTTASTNWGDKKCADLKSGDQVGVAGTAQADGSVLAVKVKWVAETAPAITGTITALTGTCPALTITVGGKTATTTSATVFSGKACGELKVGVEVAIYGAVPTGGSTLLATTVKSGK